MSAFRDLVGNGADCSGGNSLSQFTKQMQQDRSLQQDRFGQVAEGESNSGLQLRGRQGFESDNIQEFLRSGGPSGGNTAQRGMFDMQPMHRELDNLMPPNMMMPQEREDQGWGAEFSRLGNPPQQQQGMARQEGPVVNESWINEFSHGDMGPIKGIQDGPHLQSANWASEFQTHQHDLGHQISRGPDTELEDAFERAKHQASWDSEFAKTEDPTQWASEFAHADAQSWINEFKEQEGIEINSGNSKEALSQTAGMLLDAVAGSANPKFQDSKFLSFMKQLRDQEVSIEGNKVVEQVTPFGAAESWAKEFGAPISKNSWEEDFATQNATEAPPGNKLWAEEFTGHKEYDWAEEFQGNGPRLEDKRWTNEFERQQQERSWNEEFARNGLAGSMTGKATDTLGGDTDAMDDLYKSAWDYENTDFSEYTTGRALGARYDQYEFTANNPYLTQARPAGVRNLTEAILVLEAQVQQDPENAQGWYELGIRQQENENDVGAIAALRQAVRHDPGLLDSWIALAVSFTNESAREDAYDALESWLTNSERYKSLAATPSGFQNRHEDITNKYIAAARMAAEQDMDADVQVGLGVLFNISEEYNKAIDCFEAALSIRPQDYMLWNKLGATSANAQYSERAIEAYFHALEINPSYVRARYNLAISCIQMSQYREAAEHLLGALSVQNNNLNAVLAETKGKGRADENDIASMHNVQSSTVWSTLKTLADGHLRRHDLAEACEKRDLDAFRGDFDF